MSQTTKPPVSELEGFWLTNSHLMWVHGKRRTKEEMPAELVTRLDKLGFVWKTK
jgi:hypothetical protein